LPALERLPEHSSAAQPVSHPVDRLPFVEVARPASIVGFTPAPHPGVLAGPLIELEAVERSFGEYLVIGHPAIVARRCDTRRGVTSLRDMDPDDRERALVLAGLFELRITHLEDDVLWAEIAVVAQKLGGDAEATFFGAAVR
jgi:hypothetical protein